MALRPRFRLSGTLPVHRIAESSAHHEVDGVAFDLDEKRRAALLLKDEYHFLKEDLYDVGTYDAANDS